jgi:carbon storage regulator
MLILTRKVNQSIQIGPDITVMVTWVDLEGCVVKLGISAPNSVKIMRTELLAKVGTDIPSVSDRGSEHRNM